jgi:hypothetical protein
MPPTSLSQTPFFQHLLSSLPSLRGQIKDAVTASMKQWLLEIRNVSAQVGKLALDFMESRTRRWRTRREKDPMLRLSRVGSAAELVTYEKSEGDFGRYFHTVHTFTRSLSFPLTQIMSSTTINSTWISSHYTNVFISTQRSIPFMNSGNHIKQIER